eukprot:gene34236-42218_t
MVIFGGLSETGALLNDLWILDLTEVINAEDNKDAPAAVVVDPKAKAPKGNKADLTTPKGPLALWTRVVLGEASPLTPRYLHNCFISKSSGNEGFTLSVFGGSASSGPQPLSDVFEIAIARSASTGRFLAAEGSDFALSPRKVSRAHPDNADNFTGFGSVAVSISADFGGVANKPGSTSDEGASPSVAMVLVVDGSRELIAQGRQQRSRLVDSNNYMLVLDESSRLVRRV